MALPAPSASRTCLVTGASSGIGVEIANELARRGHGVTLVARREDAFRDVAQRLASAHGVRAETLAVDLTDAAARAAIPSALAGRGLEVDVLVNNAGFSTTGPVAGSDHEREIGMIRTNVEAVVDLCSLFTPGMVERGSGAVLNVASTAAFQPLPGQAGYGATKVVRAVVHTRHARRVEGQRCERDDAVPGSRRHRVRRSGRFRQGGRREGVAEMMWLSAEAVAKAAVDGMASGKAVVIPGFANRFAAPIAYLTPRRLLLPILARQHPALREK